MTERSEITTILQRELVRDPQVAGAVGPGSEAEPALEMESVHNILKLVAGAPNLRPAWFFDTAGAGRGARRRRHAPRRPGAVAAVPGAGDRLPVASSRCRRPGAGRRRSPRDELRRVTGLKQLPGELDGADAATTSSPTTRTARRPTRCAESHVRVKALWNYEAPAGAGDTHTAARARQPRAPRGAAGRRAEVAARALRDAPTGRRTPRGSRRRSSGASPRWPQARPGLAVVDEGARLRVAIPDRYRVGHEAHFAEVTERFLSYLKDPARCRSGKAPTCSRSTGSPRRRSS